MNKYINDKLYDQSLVYDAMNSAVVTTTDHTAYMRSSLYSEQALATASNTVLESSTAGKLHAIYHDTLNFMKICTHNADTRFRILTDSEVISIRGISSPQSFN
jgi:hypothetical protein